MYENKTDFSPVKTRLRVLLSSLWYKWKSPSWQDGHIFKTDFKKNLKDRFLKKIFIMIFKKIFKTDFLKNHHHN